jgi:hypothetical protein
MDGASMMISLSAFWNHKMNEAFPFFFLLFAPVLGGSFFWKREKQWVMVRAYVYGPLVGGSKKSKEFSFDP